MTAPSFEDWYAIHDLFVRYTTCLDACDVDGVVACFTPDGVIASPVAGTYEGEAGIRDFAGKTARYKRSHGGQFRHVVSNLSMAVEGDRATASCYLLDFLTRDGETTLLSPGKYECALVRRDGRWFFANRVVILDVQFNIQDF